MTATGGAEDRAALLARRLATLFAEVHPFGRGPWRPEEVAAATRVPPADLHRLCAGAPDPDGRLTARLPALAAHFRVPLDHLTAPDDAPAAVLRRRVARRLEALFAEVHPAVRGPWTRQEVAEAAGVPVEDLRRLCAGVPLAGGSFASRLDQLCLRTSPVTGRPYSNREVGAAVGRSGQHIGNLRAGVNEPGLPAATELAGFFGVSVSYFAHGPLGLVAGHFRVPEVYLTAEDGSPAVIGTEHALRTMAALRDERVQRVVDRVLDARRPR